MSVQKNDYEIIGAKFEYQEYLTAMGEPEKYSYEFESRLDQIEERYRDSAFNGIEHHNDITIISDGMNGEYVYVGIVLRKSRNYGNLDDFVRSMPVPADVNGLIYQELGLDVETGKHRFTHYR